ncbi:MAG: ABC transporter substrate-binding protein [Alphaproteobacteria bacterium]|nr:MAG: ABC transporter substrate-binding protein [Alphaproteobacteria bacterium]
MHLTRRTILRIGSLALAAPAAGILQALPGGAQTAPAPSRNWRHGLSLFGDLHYPDGFPRFDYVNPDAPRGGTVRLSALGTFDNFNVAVASVKGQLAAGLGLIYNRLLASAQDEVTTMYGLLAEAVDYPPDHSWVAYRLRPEARWHDGTPVTAEDVIFSFESWKKLDPELSAYYRHVVKAERIGEREVSFTFDSAGNRELPLIVGELTVLPKLWWQASDKNGNKRDISVTTLEPPLGAGPYRIKDFVPGRSVAYERVKDYWGDRFNVNVGQNNFEEIRFEYFRDSTVALEAFKGDQIDWRTENSAKNWATAYDFPAVRDKRVVIEEFPMRSRGVMQAFAFNIRRDKFKDPRLRRAFNFAFDFEEMNKQIFYGQYRRISSYFDGTELASSGIPGGQELEILETVRPKIPPELFATPYTNPVAGNAEAVRANLREALKLLKEAGYEIRDRKLVNAATGEQLNLEILVDDPSYERIVLFYRPSLERLGMAVSVRTVDEVQYQNRLRQWDYDMIIASWGESLSPGNEQRGYWGSQAADMPGSRNLIGIKNEAVDALIGRVIFAKDRAELVAATRALDRVLLWNFYVVPQWTYDKARTARWDRFGRPQRLPRYNEPDFPGVWWWDSDRATKVGTR